MKVGRAVPTLAVRAHDEVERLEGVVAGYDAHALGHLHVQQHHRLAIRVFGEQPSIAVHVGRRHDDQLDAARHGALELGLHTKQAHQHTSRIPPC